MNKKAMDNLTYGLFVLTAKEGDKDNGCIINTAAQVTTEPNRITIAVNKSNYTHDMVMRTGEFNISILTENSKMATYKHWGFASGRDVNKMDGLEIDLGQPASDEIAIQYRRSANGIIFLTKETNAYISAKVVQTVDLGSHTLFIADVTDAEVLSDDNSVTYGYYQKNIKPAPEKTGDKKGFICTVCGYIYEGETLPKDFICPICKHPADDFRPL